MNAPAFVVCCDTCHDAGVRYRWRQTCGLCAEAFMSKHRELHPGHVVTLSRTVEPPPFRDARTSRLTQRRGW